MSNVRYSSVVNQLGSFLLSRTPSMRLTKKVLTLRLIIYVSGSLAYLGSGLGGVLAQPSSSSSPQLHVVTITAYCACHKCCGKWSVFKKTASGTTPKQGRTVAMSRSIPFGSSVSIPSLGITNAIVEDRLAKKYDKRLDVYFNNHQDALKFGIKRDVKVWVSPKRGVRDNL